MGTQQPLGSISYPQVPIQPSDCHEPDNHQVVLAAPKCCIWSLNPKKWFKVCSVVLKPYNYQIGWKHGVC
jgi:hypothetical protein